MYKKRGGKFYFKLNLLSRPQKYVEISQEGSLTKFKYHDPAFYDRLFDYSEEGPSEVLPGSVNIGVIIKPVPDAPKLYVF